MTAQTVHSRPTSAAEMMDEMNNRHQRQNISLENDPNLKGDIQWANSTDDE